MRIPILVFLQAVALWAAVGGNRGFWGAPSYPSARIQPQGQWAFYVQNATQPNNPLDSLGDSPAIQLHTGWVGSPLHWLEMGAIWHHVQYESQASKSKDFAEFAFKVQVPRTDVHQPLLAFGCFETFHDCYAVGGLEWKSGSRGASVEIGAIRHSMLNSFDTASKAAISSFGILEFHMSSWQTILQMVRRQGEIAISPSFWWSPLPIIQIGGGAQIGTLSSEPMSSAYAGAQINLPLHKYEDTLSNPLNKKELSVHGEPWVWLDINPFYDHSYGRSGSQWRSGWIGDIAARTGVKGLYWTNSFSWSPIHSRDQVELRERPNWEKSLLLWNKERNGWPLPILAMGLLDYKTVGVALEQESGWSFWEPTLLNIQWGVGRYGGFKSRIRQPLHPTLPSFLHWTQLFVEGTYAEESIRGWAGLKIGSHFNQVVLSTGYDMDSKEILAKVDLRFDFSISKSFQNQTMQVSVMNRVTHRFESAVLGMQEYFKPWFEGNSPKHEILETWTPRAWLGSERRILPLQSCDASKTEWEIVAKLDFCQNADYDNDRISNGKDKCPIEAEDHDGFQDKDGCPEIDNDLDGIKDEEDLCPKIAEDRNGIQDQDGCPEIRKEEVVLLPIMQKVTKIDDQDGVPLERDACPDQAEDLDQFDDEDGCPDLDNDLDGLPDVEDACPNEAGNRAGSAEYNGCIHGQF